MIKSAERMKPPLSDPLSRLTIPPEKKAPVRGIGLLPIGLVCFALLLFLLIFLATRPEHRRPAASRNSASPPSNSLGRTSPPTPERFMPAPTDRILTASGYIVPRERIELSAQFPATVESIAVKKGDRVKKGDLIVKLEDAEYRARLLEAQGRLALAQANTAHAEAQHHRQLQLNRAGSTTAQDLDDARRVLEAAKAEVAIAQGQLALAQTWLNWCTIEAPIDGTILEKLVDVRERVIPQSFGSPRGPSTTLVALADLTDLQVEIDLNERDTPKVRLHQRCRIRPESYPDRIYSGSVAEIAPEANRQKGTLQVKVQILKPDAFLTPELTAKVDFLSDAEASIPEEAFGEAQPHREGQPPHP